MTLRSAAFPAPPSHIRAIRAGSVDHLYDPELLKGPGGQVFSLSRSLLEPADSPRWGGAVVRFWPCLINLQRPPPRHPASPRPLSKASRRECPARTRHDLRARSPPCRRNLMPLYMDTHRHVEGLTKDAVADAHRKVISIGFWIGPSSRVTVPASASHGIPPAWPVKIVAIAPTCSGLAFSSTKTTTCPSPS